MASNGPWRRWIDTSPRFATYDIVPWQETPDGRWQRSSGRSVVWSRFYRNASWGPNRSHRETAAAERQGVATSQFGRRGRGQRHPHSGCVWSLGRRQRVQIRRGAGFLTLHDCQSRTSKKSEKQGTRGAQRRCDDGTMENAIRGSFHRPGHAAMDRPRSGGQFLGGSLQSITALEHSRQPFDATETSGLKPAPRHYLYMFDLPF